MDTTVAESRQELCALVERRRSARPSPLVELMDSDMAASSSSSDGMSPSRGRCRHFGRSIAMLGRSGPPPPPGAVPAMPDRLYDAPDDAPGAEPRGPPEPGAEDRPYVPSPEYARTHAELGVPLGPEHCFACRVVRDSDHTPPVCRAGIDTIVRLVRSSCGYDKVQVARDIAELYEQQIRRKINERRRPGEGEFPEWRAADIYEHFFTQRHGRVDATASLEQRILFFERALQDMRDHYVYTEVPRPDGTTVRIPEPRRLAEAMRLSRDLDRMYMIQPSKMPLANSDSVVLRRTEAINHRPEYGRLPTGAGFGRH